MMSRRRKIYEGKAKILYEGPEPGTLIQYFKDDTTAFNAEKHAILDGKGVLNNRLSEFFMTRLAGIGIPTHFIKRINMREQLVKQVEIDLLTSLVHARLRADCAGHWPLGLTVRALRSAAPDKRRHCKRRKCYQPVLHKTLQLSINLTES